MAFGYIGLLVVAILIPSPATAANTSAEEERRVFAEKISEINEGLPKMIDNETRWDSTVAAGTNVSYLFTLLNITKDDAPPNIGFHLYRHALNEYCTPGGYINYLREYEVELSMYYRDVDGNVVASLMISNEDCQKEVTEEAAIVTEPELGDTIVVDSEWLSLSDQLFADTIEVWPAADNLYERLLGKWQNDETAVIYQFLSNGDAHRIEGNSLKMLKYTVQETNRDKRIMLVKINENIDSVYQLFIQFYPLDQRARVAIVKQGNKTLEGWTYAGRPDLIAIANQYGLGRKPWISRGQLQASKEYKDLDERDRSSARRSWEELFGNNRQN